MKVNGAAIKALREAYGWKPSKFAIAVGISHGFLTNIEKGERNPSAEVARKIADAIGGPGVVPLAAITNEAFPLADVMPAAVAS